MANEKAKKPKILAWTELSSVGRARSRKIAGGKIHIDDAPKQPLETKKILIQLAILAILTILAYSPTLFGKTFVYMDAYLTGPFQDQVVDANFWLMTIAGAAVSPLSQAWLKAGLATDLNSFRFEPAWYHIINIGLQIMSVSYFYVLILRLARYWLVAEETKHRSYAIAFVSSLIFACHPLAVESVGYISGRGGVLAGCNCFLALNLFLVGFWSSQLRTVILAYAGALAALAMAIGASPEGLAIPFVVVALAFLLKPRQQVWYDWLDERGAEVSIWVLLALLLPWTAKLPFRLEFSNCFGLPPLSAGLYLATQCKDFLFYYLRCALVPVGLSIDPPNSLSTGFSDIGTILGALVLALIPVASFCFRRNFSIAWPLALVGAGFLPSLLVLRNEYISDTRFYISLAGLSMLAGWQSVLRTKQQNWQHYLPIALVVVTLFGLTVWRCFDWRSDKGLWNSALALAPQSVRARAMAGAVILEGGDNSKAKEEMRHLIQEEPQSQLAYLVLGDCYLAEKRYHDAVPILAKALELAKAQRMNGYETIMTKRGLAESLVQTGKYADASKLLAQLIVQEPGSTKTNLLLAKALIGMDQPGIALKYLNTGYKRDPLNAQYLEPIAEACLASGIPKLVRNAYGAARYGSRVIPSTKISLILAQAAIELNHSQEAIVELNILLGAHNKANLESSDKAKALYLKGLAEKQMGNGAEAAELMHFAQTIDAGVAAKLNIKMVGESTNDKPSLVAPPRQKY